MSTQLTSPAPETQALAIQAEKKRRQFSPWLMLTIVSIALAAFFVAWPIVNVLISSFTSSTEGPFAGWVVFFSDPTYVTALGNTLLLAAIVTVLATVIGVYLAYFMSRFKFLGEGCGGGAPHHRDPRARGHRDPGLADVPG